MTRARRPRRRAAALRDAVRDRLWPLPAAAIVLALVGAVALSGLDRAVDAELPAGFRSWVFGGDADAARSLLSSIATAIMTVTSLTFSLTVVTLQLASSQYSPRLLRTGADFVPRIAVTLTFAFTVASVVTLVVFLARLAESIRPESILRTVHDEAVETARRTLIGASTLEQHLQAPRSAGRLVAPRSGFVVTVDVDALVRRAVEHDAVVLLEVPVGSSVVEGTTIARAWSREHHRTLSGSDREALQEAVDRAVKVGRERTAVDDVTFGLQQVSDVALKALSPGVNDPTTAVHALGRSAAVLSVLAGLPLGDVVHEDPDGVRRVVLHQADLHDLLRLSVGHCVHYGVADPAVAARLYQLLREVGESCTTQAGRDAVRAQLDALVDADRHVERPRADRDLLSASSRQAHTALDVSLGAR